MYRGTPITSTVISTEAGSRAPPNASAFARSLPATRSDGVDRLPYPVRRIGCSGVMSICATPTMTGLDDGRTDPLDAHAAATESAIAVSAGRYQRAGLTGRP